MLQAPTKAKHIVNMDNTTENDNQKLSGEQQALRGQIELNAEITKHKVETLKLILRLEKIGGGVDYKVTIVEALKAFGTPLSLTFLSQVLPDHALLSAARKELIEKGIVDEVTAKTRKTLHLVNAA